MRQIRLLIQIFILKLQNTLCNLRDLGPAGFGILKRISKPNVEPKKGRGKESPAIGMSDEASWIHLNAFPRCFYDVQCLCLQRKQSDKFIPNFAHSNLISNNNKDSRCCL